MPGTKLRKQTRRMLPVCSPAPFYRNRITAPRPLRLAEPAWDWLLTAAFRSPATAVSLETTIPGSTFPTCRVGASPFRFRSPFGLLLPSPKLWGPGEDHRNLPVAPFPFRRFQFLPGFHSPSRLAPFRIKAFDRFVTEKPALRYRPIASRSPWPLLLLASASDHRSRLATTPEARCSSNLLEPFSNMPRVLPKVKFFWARKHVFPEHFCAIKSSDLQPCGGGNVVEKTRGAGNVYFAAS